MTGASGPVATSSGSDSQDFLTSRCLPMVPPYWPCMKMASITLSTLLPSMTEAERLPEPTTDLPGDDKESYATSANQPFPSP